jgi:hypothetical protein
MGSIAERTDLRREAHDEFERGCANDDCDGGDDDAAFSCRTDLTTVQVSITQQRGRGAIHG